MRPVVRSTRADSSLAIAAREEGIALVLSRVPPPIDPDDEYIDRLDSNADMAEWRAYQDER